MASLDPSATVRQSLIFRGLVVLAMLGPSVLMNAAIAADTITADAGSYGVQPGDVLQISVWKEEDLKLEVLVRPDGGFSFPLAGDIKARGRSVEDLRAEIVSRIEKYIPDPAVTVAIKEIVGNKVYVIGKVNRPGEFVMKHEIDVMQALSMAGGTATFAALNKIIILRREGDKQTAIPFKYAEVEGGERLDQNIVLRNGDVVVVP